MERSVTQGTPSSEIILLATVVLPLAEPPQIPITNGSTCRKWLYEYRMLIPIVYGVSLLGLLTNFSKFTVDSAESADTWYIGLLWNASLCRVQYRRPKYVSSTRRLSRRRSRSQTVQPAIQIRGGGLFKSQVKNIVSIGFCTYSWVRSLNFRLVNHNSVYYAIFKKKIQSPPTRRRTADSKLKNGVFSTICQHFIIFLLKNCF